MDTKIRPLTIVDTVTLVSPPVDVWHNYRGSHVVETLEPSTAEFEAKTIRGDNGPEFITKELDLR